MRALVKLARNAVNICDGLITYAFGKEIWYTEVIVENFKDGVYYENVPKTWATKSTMLYGLMDYKKTDCCSAFGIDGPDTAVIHFNYSDVVRRLGCYPKIGSLLTIGDTRWIIVQRQLEDNKWMGQYRLNLICDMYVENITTAK